jgi:hypothetical protein
MNFNVEISPESHDPKYERHSENIMTIVNSKGCSRYLLALDVKGSIYSL